jgi:DNA-binding transcriptional LysR family regulator
VAGLAFRDDAAAALSQLEQAMLSARLAANGKLGLLRIAFISTVGSEIVPRRLEAVQKLATRMATVA